MIGVKYNNVYLEFIVKVNNIITYGNKILCTCISRMMMMMMMMTYVMDLFGITSSAVVLTRCVLDHCSNLVLHYIRRAYG